jgi:hypothetical protein
MAALTIPERNKSFGYMVGGSFESSKYQDNINSYQYTEGGLDYNAGLVGALAYIVSKLAPADTSKFGVAEPPQTVQTPATIKISLSDNPSDTASFIKDSIPASSLYGSAGVKTLYAHVFDQNDSVISNVICNTMTWSYTHTNVMSPGTPPQSVPGGSGCSFTGDIMDEDVITSVTATYAFVSADRLPPISKSIIVYEPPISVLPRNISLAKHGCAMTVKPRAVTFTAAAGNEITALGIYNIQGKRIFTTSGNHREITWNRANSPRGMYMVKLTMNNGMIVQKNLILK